MTHSLETAGARVTPGGLLFPAFTHNLAFDLAVEQLSLTHATASELKTLVAAAPNEFARGWLAGIQLMHSQLELVQDAAGARLQLVQEHRVTNKCSNSRS